MAEFLECVEISSASPVWSVIWMHGLGADGHDFEPIVPELGLQDRAVRFIFPHAPVRPVTLNGGMPMRAWFDLGSLHPDGGFDREGFDASRRQLLDLVARENARGIPTDRIILAGFSQGGAMALATGLMLEEKLAGIVGLSTFLFPQAKTGIRPAEANLDTPVFMAHGEMDPVVPLAFGKATREQLESFGMTVQWKQYMMPHSVCAEEIEDLGRWFLERMA